MLPGALNRGTPVLDRIDACKPRRVTIAGLFNVRPMIKNPEHPPQDVIQERVKRDPAIGSPAHRMAVAASLGLFIVPGRATPLLP